jgi:acetolactate synthase regulatory subunit
MTYLDRVISLITKRGFEVKEIAKSDSGKRQTINLTVNAVNSTELIPWIPFNLGASGKVVDCALPSYPSDYPQGFLSCHEYVAVHGDRFASNPAIARKLMREETLADQIARARVVTAPAPAPATVTPAVNAAHPAQEKKSAKQ